MTPEQNERFRLLRQREVPFEFIAARYGVDLTDRALADLFRRWSEAAHKGRVVMTSAAVDRHAFELFLQAANFVPRRFAAASLGMSERSLVEVLDALNKTGLFPSARIEWGAALMSGKLISEFASIFPGLKFRIFGSYPDMCRRLHAEIRAELTVEVEPLFCVTGAALGEPTYARGFDAISEEPVGMPWQIFLDTKKPIQLEPDIVGTLFFARNTDVLGPHLFAGVLPPNYPRIEEFARTHPAPR